MAKQLYYPPEVCLLLLSNSSLLQSLSADFAGFSDVEEQEQEWGGF